MQLLTSKLSSFRSRLKAFRTDCLLHTGIGLLFFFTSAYVHQPPSHCPTPLSRLDLLHALFAGSIRIDAYHSNTPDKAEFQNHYYSDKAPGAVILALPSFFIAATILQTCGVSPDSDLGWLFTSWVACAGSVGIITAIGAGCLFEWLSRRIAAKYALLTVCGVFFGAAPLPYATMMYSHSLVIGLLCISLWAIEKHAARRERWDLFAGFTCGWAVTSEYTAGIVGAGLFLLILSKKVHRAVWFCLGAIPPLTLILGYNWACFGNALILPYSLNESFPQMKEGLYAIKWPDPLTAYNLLLSPTRGLLFWTPFLLIAICGYKTLFDDNKPLFFLTYSIPLLHAIVISGRTWDWQAGPSLGPRYLAPILPLLALPCAIGVQRFPRLGFFLATYSILITTLATLTDACPAGEIYNPLFQWHVPLFIGSQFSPNLGAEAGLAPYTSFVVFYLLLLGGIMWLWRRVGNLSQLAVCEVSSAKEEIKFRNKTDSLADR